jgi:hypothetical protein
MNDKNMQIKRLVLILLAAAMAGVGIAAADGSGSSNSDHRKRGNACKNDIEQLCSSANDRSSRRQCIRENRDQMSQGCQNALESRRKHRKGGERRNRPDEASS